MKKVLIITYYWPPSGGGGVQRWLKFAKYLRNFGWEPVIYTPENPERPAVDESLCGEIPEGVEVLKTPVWEPYRLYKQFTGRKKSERIQTAFLTEKKKPGLTEKISVWIRGNLFIPDARKFWIAPSVNYLKDWLKNNPVDVIVSTGPPHSMHLIGMQLKTETGIPWLADFRDPWTNIDFYKDLKLTSWADRKHHHLEQKVLQQADAVTLISSGMAKDFKRIVGRDYHLITNGFDEDDFKGITPTSNQGKFKLSHVGSLVKSRNPKILWQALTELVAEDEKLKKDLEIALTGTVDLSVRQDIAEFGLDDHVQYKAYLPHNQLVNEFNSSTALLLLINDTPNAGLILTGKFFEYMAANRPIICLGPTDGDAARILNETQTGFAFGFDEKEKLKERIKALYAAFRAANLVQHSTGIEEYSRKNLTKKLAFLMDSLLT